MDKVGLCDKLLEDSVPHPIEEKIHLKARLFRKLTGLNVNISDTVPFEEMLKTLITQMKTLKHGQDNPASLRLLSLTLRPANMEVLYLSKILKLR